jgi:Zn-finger nucleic acid-binding protein
MKCPACHHDLAPVQAGPITVDACAGGCGGLWFDNFELLKVDEEHEEAGRDLLEVAIDPEATVDRSERRKCPRCADMVMARHYFSPKRAVAVDHCAGCNGFWLDPGELKAIRGEFASEVERRQAAEDHFSEVFSGEMAHERGKTEAKLEKYQRFAHALRLACPSYYIPGKQRWGAF